jgi:chromosomal replication initiator protein
MNTLIKDNWEEIMKYLKETHGIADASYKIWFSPLVVHNENDNSVTLLYDDKKADEAQLKFTIEYLTKKYIIFIKESILQIVNKDVEIKILAPGDVKGYNKRLSNQEKRNVFRSEKSNLNPRYTFENYVVGSNNQLANSAALAVAENPGREWNPFFIYGGVGLGKTHLMHAIANYILDQNSSAKVLYVTSENFTNEVITAIREGAESTNAFRKKYRGIDVLLIDDIQFIIGKESTQEEFFHTFNTLYEAKKQIIISSDKPPKDFNTLEERLRSRFEMGLIVDIQQPDYETRMAILNKKEEIDGLSIANNVIEYIADNIKSNIRELEGALNKVTALSRLKKIPVTLELAQEALKDHFAQDNNKEVTPDFIVQIVADQYGIDPGDIKSKKRSQDIALPRQIVMYLCNKCIGMSSTEIGRYLERDHSTVIHGIDKMAEVLAAEKKSGKNDITSRIDVIKKKLSL